MELGSGDGMEDCEGLGEEQVTRWCGIGMWEGMGMRVNIRSERKDS